MDGAYSTWGGQQPVHGLTHETDHLEELDVQVNTILQSNSKEQDRNAWDGLIWLRTAPRGVLL